MPKRLTQQEFAKKVRENLGDSLDLSQFTYTGHRGKGTVICPSHGAYSVSASSLLNGCGCEKCYRDRQGLALVKTKEQFLLDALTAHGSKYDYSKTEYVRSNKKVTIICPKHGEFRQLPTAHTAQGHGCPKCSSLQVSLSCRMSQEGFIEKAISVHGDRYDLSQVSYRGQSEKINVICRSHGVFRTTAGNFIHRSSGCPRCKSETTAFRCRISLKEYISRARKVHGDRFQYTGVDYERGGAVLHVQCPVHGLFKQGAPYHLRGGSCEMCSKPVRDTSSFIAEAVKVHGNRYNYDESQYLGCAGKTKIICPDHGPYFQVPSQHVHMSHGCPRCAKVGPSKGQLEVQGFLEHYTQVVQNHRIDKRKEIDIFLPLYNVGVEFHGLIWHSERFSPDPTRDFKKHMLAQEKGIRLIHIYEDEWALRPDAVKSLLLQVIGERLNRIFARNTCITPVSHLNANAFYESNHIQGGVSAVCEHVGLRHCDQLVAVMSFSRLTSHRGRKADEGVIELRRFASSINVVGGASKILRNYLNSNPCVRQVVSYSDNRLFKGGMYAALGFKAEYVSRPSYYYVSPNNSSRLHKSGFRLSALAKREGFTFDPSLSERENCRNNGWFRLYDCGKTRWVLNV